MPPPLANLYCTPNDIFELVGIDAVQLREDDRNQASGQTLQLSAAASVGATSLTVYETQYGMLSGSVLVFENAGLNPPVSVTLTAVALPATTTLSVAALTTALPAGAGAIDNGVNTWLAGMMAKGCKYATATIKRYCCNRYNDTDLVNSWSVNDWATTIAARWISKRRFNSPPGSIEEDYQRVMDELVKVQCDKLNIEDIGTRSAGWPFMDNLTMDDRMTIGRVRVESIISDPIPVQGIQLIDWSSVFAFSNLW